MFPVNEVEDVHGDNVEASRGNAGLGQTQEETSSEESRVALNETLSERDTSENNQARGDFL